MLKTRKLLLYTVILMALLASATAAYAASLSITVKTSKSGYNIGEAITIQGYLSYNGLPVPYTAVGLQVFDPVNSVVVSRSPETDAAGTYSLTFSLPDTAKHGTYNVQVSATYNGETANAGTYFFYPPPPIPGFVGGTYFQVNKFELLAPSLGLTLILLIATVALSISIKRVKRGKQKQ